ncbi:MAG: glycerol-3-phosphate ABC transporter ATP-binding protein, partial [Chloroflexota bacterium]
KQPLVFLLDEPFSNLDASLRARMRTEVKHLHLALGTTSVFVTHDQEEAMTLSDLICVMRDGKIVQSGSQAEIYTRPRNVYVAEFVGKPRMSLVNGSLEHGADSVTFVGNGLRIDLGPAGALGLAGGSPNAAVLGLRAEDVIVTTDTSNVESPGFAAKVGLTEPIGSDTFVELDVGETSIVARVDPDLSLALDQPVVARLRRSGIHLFDRETGERIN